MAKDSMVVRQVWAVEYKVAHEGFPWNLSSSSLYLQEGEAERDAADERERWDGELEFRVVKYIPESSLKKGYGERS